MIRRTLSLACLASVAALVLTGCMKKLDIQTMKEMKPERPAELDLLNMMVGDWTNTAEIRIRGLDEVLRGTGKSHTAWEADGWCLVERSEFDMGELGKMSGIGIWTWDPKIKKYRNWWFDSRGESSAGTATYDEETRTWRMKSRGRSPHGRTTGRGTVTRVDDDTMEWNWTEWDGLKLIKFAEYSGTSRRK